MACRELLGDLVRTMPRGNPGTQRAQPTSRDNCLRRELRRATGRVANWASGQDGHRVWTTWARPRSRPGSRTASGTSHDAADQPRGGRHRHSRRATNAESHTGFVGKAAIVSFPCGAQRLTHSLTLGKRRRWDRSDVMIGQSPGRTSWQKKAGCHTAGNEGATQNGEGLDYESPAAQTFPLRGPRRQRHLNNWLYDRVSREKFPLFENFFRWLASKPSSFVRPLSSQKAQAQSDRRARIRRAPAQGGNSPTPRLWRWRSAIAASRLPEIAAFSPQRSRGTRRPAQPQPAREIFPGAAYIRHGRHKSSADSVYKRCSPPKTHCHPSRPRCAPTRRSCGRVAVPARFQRKWWSEPRKICAPACRYAR